MKPKILLSVGAKVDNYVNAINGCGAVAEAFYCPKNCSDYDGLILSGGCDINPVLYSEDIDGAENIDDKRDSAEIAVIKEFVQLNKPIFGICRGHQLLNVFFGGSLYQHISNDMIHRGKNGEDSVHFVSAVKPSIFSEIYGTEFATNSMHHQAVKRIGEGFDAVLAAEDEYSTVEAMIHRTLPIMSVQWHPERMCFTFSRKDTVDGRLIFEHFINMCK